MAIETNPSDTVLDEAPARALKFLAAMSTNAYVWAALARRGYSDAEHEKGWQLLFKATGYRKPLAPAVDRSEASAAIAEIDAWDEPTFRVSRAALAGPFREQCEYLFQDLEPQTGAGAIVSVTTFLDRLDALDGGDKSRAATKKKDHAAVAKLAERGITPEARKGMRKLLATALTAPPELAPEATADGNAEARRAAKGELRQWYAEWSEVAKADLRRRDHLILLGLAKRKVKKKEAKDPAEKPAAGGAK